MYIYKIGHTFLLVIALCGTCVSFAQKDKISNDTISYVIQPYKIETMDNASMAKILLTDYFHDKLHRKEKRECYSRYANILLKNLKGLVIAPIGYVKYYLLRRKITKEIEYYYKTHHLTNIENIGNDIISGKINPNDLKEFMGDRDYNLWLYGDTTDPLNTGGVGKEYKPNLPMFWRRWFFSAIRNPYWNATYINNYSNNIIQVITPYDDRTSTITHNYGTSDTRLGTWFRWYIDDNGDWWFFYETTKRTSKNKGRLIYFGSVGCGGIEDGIYQKTKKGRFEMSLNRSVTISE